MIHPESVAQLSGDEAASLCAALGAPQRLAILRMLVRAGLDGLATGVLQARLDMPASTLSHHLRALVTAGAVSQEREGRVLRCRAQFHQVSALAQFLMQECCADQIEEKVG